MRSSNACERVGLHPSHMPAAIDFASGRHVHPLRDLRRVPVPDRREGRRRDRDSSTRRCASERAAADRQPGHAPAHRRRPASASSPPRSSAAARRRSSTPACSCCRPARSTARCSCCARPTRAIRRPGQLLRRGRPLLHEPQLHRDHGGRRRGARNDTRFPKTLTLNDYYFGGDASDRPLGNLQLLGKIQEPMLRGALPERAQVVARLAAPSTASTGT